MQQLKDSRYYIKLNKEVLFGKQLNWKSKYSPWLYVCLKLSYNYMLQHNREHYIKINYRLYTKLFRTSRKTIFCAVQELVSKGLLIKLERSNSYKMVDENTICTNTDKSNYVVIFHNFLYKLLEENLSIRQLVIYYYLVFITHMFKHENNYTKSNETQTSIVRSIRSRSAEVKKAIEGLTELGLLTSDEYGRLYVLRQNGQLTAAADDDAQESITEENPAEDNKLGSECFTELLENVTMTAEQLKDTKDKLSAILFNENLSSECRKLLFERYSAIKADYENTTKEGKE